MKYYIVDDYVIAGILMSYRFIPFIRPDRNRHDRMIFVFKNTEEFKAKYIEIREDRSVTI